jgi:hypothetical protein
MNSTDIFLSPVRPVHNLKLSSKFYLTGAQDMICVLAAVTVHSAVNEHKSSSVPGG